MKVYPIYFLDADETLFDFKRSEAESIRRCLLSFGLPADEETVFLYHTINDRLWKALERGEVDQKTLRVRRFEELLNTLERRFLPRKPPNATPRSFPPARICCPMPKRCAKRCHSAQRSI